MKKLLFKTILVAAAMCVGTSAWASESGTIDFVAQSRCTYSTSTHTFTTASNAGNGYALAVADLSNLPNIASATSVTIEFDVVVNGRLIIGIGDKNVRGTIANGSSKSTYNTEGIIMRYAKIDDNYVRVNGGSNNSEAIGVTSHVSFTLNRKTGKYSYTITDEGGTSTYFSGSNISTSVSNSTIIEAYSWANSQTNALSAVSYSYELETYDYSVTAKDESGNNLKADLISGTSSDGTDVVVDCPYAFQEGGIWYVKANYTYTVSINHFDNNPSVTYKADPSIVYYSEGEDLNSNTASAGLSNGAYGHVAGGSGTSNKGKTIGTFGSGAYQASAYFVSADISRNRGFYIRNSNEANASDANVLASVKTTTVGLYSTNTFMLSENTPLTVSGVTSSDNKVNQSAEFDYILVRKLNIATLGTNGYATFACPYPLDLTTANMPTGLKAYKASVSGTTVTFTELNQTVPANTGILLQGEAGGSYNIPVVASGTEVTENAFLVNTDGTTFAGDNDYYYFGLLKNTLTFGTFDPSSVAIPASKAYLKVLKSSLDAGARLNISFADDEPTGIADVRGKMSDVRGGYYNLSGLRVDQPQKGLYIVNGKKVVIK